MDHLIGMLLGSLLGWSATLFLEHRRWLPRRGDLIGGSVGGLLGSLTATLTDVAVIGAVPTAAEALAALAGAGVAIALWRTGRSLRPSAKQPLPFARRPSASAH